MKAVSYFSPIGYKGYQVIIDSIYWAYSKYNRYIQNCLSLSFYLSSKIHIIQDFLVLFYFYFFKLFEKPLRWYPFPLTPPEEEKNDHQGQRAAAKPTPRVSFTLRKGYCVSSSWTDFFVLNGSSDTTGDLDIVAQPKVMNRNTNARLYIPKT